MTPKTLLGYPFGDKCQFFIGVCCDNLGIELICRMGHSCNIGNAPNLVGKNQKLRSECCQSIFDMGLHSL